MGKSERELPRWKGDENWLRETILLRTFEASMGGVRSKEAAPLSPRSLRQVWEFPQLSLNPLCSADSRKSSNDLARPLRQFILAQGAFRGLKPDS